MSKPTLIKTTLICALSALMLSGCSNQADKSRPAKSSTVDAAAKTANADNAASQEHQGELPVIDAIVTHAPEVPPPVDRDHPAKVVVKWKPLKSHASGRWRGISVLDIWRSSSRADDSCA